MMMISNKVTCWVHEILLPYVQKADFLVDGTAGNGFDTLYLAKNSKSDATIFSYDLQELALNRTEKLLREYQLEQRVQLKLGNHRDLLPEGDRKLDVGILNLGYLPQGDPTITTQTENTMETIKKWLTVLNLHGVISITCYPGHAEGEREYQKVAEFLRSLPSKYFQVMRAEGWNRSNKPPVPFFIERVRKETKS